MRLLTRVRLRVRSLIAAHRAERDLEDEIRGHIERQVDQYRSAGVSAAGARDAALRDFGNVLLVREQCRDTWGRRLLDQAIQDGRGALRGLVRAPGFALVAVATLALGIGANTAIFTLLDAVVFKPLPVPTAVDLVTVYEKGPEGQPDVGGGTGRFLRFSYPRFQRLAGALGDAGTLAAGTRDTTFPFRTTGSAAQRFASVQLVSGRYFETLGLSPEAGRLLVDDDERQASAVVVLSDAFCKRVFGAGKAAVGQPITIGIVPGVVVGVTPPGFVGVWTDGEAEAWMPLTLQPALHYNNNVSSYGPTDRDAPWMTQDAVSWLNLVARIPRANRTRASTVLVNANQRGIEAFADALAARQEGDNGARQHMLVLAPFSRGFSGLRAQFSKTLYVLMSLVALVLLMTCANIANLLLARATGRARDISVRIALGATTARLALQYVAESLTLSAIGGVAGIVLGEWGSRLLARQVLSTSGDLPSVFSPDSRVLLFGCAASLTTAVLFGAAPARRAIRGGRQASVGITQRVAIGSDAMRGMRLLVTGQVALATVVVFVALLLGRTLVNFLRVDPGFVVEGLVSGSVDPITSGYTAAEMPGLSDRVIEAARGIPGVVSAGMSRCGLIAGCSSSSSFHLDSPASPGTVSLYMNWISSSYFQTVGIPLERGRAFDASDVSAAHHVAIVNEAAARLFRDGQAMGQRLGSNAADTEVVGVVRDAHTQSLHDPPAPMVYFPIGQDATNLRAVALTNLDVRVTGPAEAAVDSVRSNIRRAEPRLLLRGVTTMAERLSRDVTRERLVAGLTGGLGSLTLLLASLGLYGVLSYSVARRTQEIGVRVALGATRAEIVRLVVGQSLAPIAAGMTVGFGVAAAFGHYLTSLLFNITPLDPSTFIAVAALFAIVAMLASFLPARRAMRLDPAVALRCE